MALAEKELSTAEVAFAAIDEVGKLQYVLADRMCSLTIECVLLL